MVNDTYIDFVLFGCRYIASLKGFLSFDSVFDWIADRQILRFRYEFSHPPLSLFCSFGRRGHSQMLLFKEVPRFLKGENLHACGSSAQPISENPQCLSSPVNRIIPELECYSVVGPCVENLSCWGIGLQMGFYSPIIWKFWPAKKGYRTYFRLRFIYGSKSKFRFNS